MSVNPAWCKGLPLAAAGYKGDYYFKDYGGSKMPHVLKMKDGKLLTPFGIRDLLDAVEDYAGEDLRREIEEYIAPNVEGIDAYEKEYDRMERDGERLADHQRSVLCNIRDEVDALDALLQDTRLNRRRMQGAVRIIQQMINREL